MKRDSERIYDEFLVAAAITGDRLALQRLVARWQPRLWRHARRVLGNADRAKDMVQEAWMEIIKGLGQLDDVVAFPAWAYRIVTRRCQRTFVAESHAEQLARYDAPEHGREGTDQDAGEIAVELSVVMDAISTLPAPQRVAMALFYLEEFSVAEIAVATDVPPGTVKTRLLHARRKVRAILTGENS